MVVAAVVVEVVGVGVFVGGRVVVVLVDVDVGTEPVIKKIKGVKSRIVH